MLVDALELRKVVPSKYVAWRDGFDAWINKLLVNSHKDGLRKIEFSISDSEEAGSYFVGTVDIEQVAYHLHTNFVNLNYVCEYDLKTEQQEFGETFFDEFDKTTKYHEKIQQVKTITFKVFW